MTSASRETPQETTEEEQKLEVTIRLHVKDKEMRLDAAAASGFTYLGVILALREEQKTALVVPTAADNHDVLNT